MRFHTQLPIALCVLCSLTLTVAACKPAKSHAFALVEFERPEEKPAFQDSSVADSEVVEWRDAAKLLTDAGMGDAGTVVEDASAKDAGLFECPTGHFMGNFECESEGGVNKFAGTIEFTLTEISDGFAQSSIIEATARGYVPADPDAAPPVILPLPALLEGTLYCGRTKPTRVSLDFAKPFAELVASWDWDWDPLETEPQSEANARFEAYYDEEGDSFDGKVTTSPAPACEGIVKLSRAPE